MPRCKECMYFSQNYEINALDIVDKQHGMCHKNKSHIKLKYDDDVCDKFVYRKYDDQICECFIIANQKKINQMLAINNNLCRQIYEAKHDKNKRQN